MMETHGCLVHSGLWFLPSDVSVASTDCLSRPGDCKPWLRGWGGGACCSLRSVPRRASGSLSRLVQEEGGGPWQAARGRGGRAELELALHELQIPSLGSASSQQDAWHLTRPLPSTNWDLKLKTRVKTKPKLIPHLLNRFFPGRSFQSSDAPEVTWYAGEEVGRWQVVSDGVNG